MSARPRDDAERSLAWERPLVAVALVLLAAHVLVAFLDREPGTAWDDRILGPAVALALLAGTASMYRRAPAGARAIIAAVLGLLALEAAALAVLDASRTFSRASDWTGFLLGPLGVALLVLAAMLLWRSRKRGGRRRYLRRVGIALASLVAAYWLLLPVLVAIYATNRPREEARSPALGAAQREVVLRTDDDLLLAASYVPSRNGAAIVVYPTRAAHAAVARMLVRHGYGVLALDMRGYGGSEGNPNAFGWGSTPDLDTAVAWLARRPEVRAGRVGGIGFSVGGELLLEAAAGNGALRAVVADGAGERSVRETRLRGVRALAALPEAFVQTAAVSVLAQRRPPPSLKDVVARISPSAVLLVYAEHGAGGEDLAPTYYDAASSPKRIWRVPDATHTKGFETHPIAYERRIVGFFDSYLAQR